MSSPKYGNRPKRPTDTKGFFLGLFAGMGVGFAILAIIIGVWVNSMSP